MAGAGADAASAGAQRFVAAHRDAVAGALATSGRSHLAALVGGLPSRAAAALMATRAAQATDAAALAATATAVEARAAGDVVEAVRCCDVAMCFGGVAAAEVLLPLLDAVEEEGREKLFVIPEGIAGCFTASASKEEKVGPRVFEVGEVAREAAEGLSVERFRVEFFRRERAVLICELAQVAGWSAVARWADPTALCRLLGHRSVPVEAGDGTERFALFQDVLLSMSEGEERLYLAQHPLLDYVPALRKDFRVPEYVKVGGGTEEDVLANVWIGGKGTGTRLHTDTADNLLTQVVGTKAVTLFDASETKHLYARPGDNFSPCDIDQPDLDAHPELKNAKATTCVLQPGDSLYIPAGCWHWVRATSPSISINFFF